MKRRKGPRPVFPRGHRRPAIQLTLPTVLSAGNGLVFAPLAAIDVAAIDCTVITEREADAIRAQLHRKAASHSQVQARLEADVAARRSARDEARLGAEAAAGERAAAVDQFQAFERGLASVVEATGALADAQARELDAESELKRAEALLEELRGHRAALEHVVEEAESRARCAEELARLGEEPVLPIEVDAKVARCAREAAEANHGRWLALADALRQHQVAAAAEAENLRTLVDGLGEELASHRTDIEDSVRSALAAYDAATVAESDRLAAALADRWVQANERLAELDRLDPVPTDEELAAAAERVHAAELALSGAAESAKSGAMTTAEREAIERAHAEVIESGRLRGRGGRQRQRQAEEQLEELLGAHGLSNWVEYLTMGLSADAEKNGLVAVADRELAEARTALAALQAAFGSPERVAVLDELEALTQSVTDVLGFWPKGNIERHLRAQPLVDPASSVALFTVLSEAGLMSDSEPIAAAARRWLAEADAGRRAVSAIEDALATAAGAHDGLLAVSSGPALAELAALVRGRIASADERVRLCADVESHLAAAVAGVPDDQAANRVQALHEGHGALRWAMSTADDVISEAHARTSLRMAQAVEARTAAEGSLDDAWGSLRACSAEPLPDLPTAVMRLEALVAALQLTSGSVGSAEDASRMAEAALAEAEEALTAHRATAEPSREPTAERIAARLAIDLAAGHGPVVFEDPFPGIEAATFARVVHSLADLTSRRLVIYLSDRVVVHDDATIPPAESVVSSSAEPLDA